MWIEACLFRCPGCNRPVEDIIVKDDAVVLVPGELTLRDIADGNTEGVSGFTAYCLKCHQKKMED